MTVQNVTFEQHVAERLARGTRHDAPRVVPWVLPLILVLGLFYLYPVFDVMRLAFMRATLLANDGTYTLSTLIDTLSRPELGQILWVTFVFTGSSVVAQQLLGLVIALVVVRGEGRGLFGTTIVRTTALVAWVVPGIAGGIIWKMLFNEAPFGGLNSILRLMGAAPVQWLSDPDLVMWS
ncbi:MAG: sugar ABC transporter permease, partial [Pararhizobium sp.]